MDDVRGALDLAAQFAETGRTWFELDDKGRVVRRGAAGTPAAKRPAAKKSAAAKKTTAKGTTVAKRTAGGRAKVRTAR